MKKKIALIGLGNMGANMAKRLVQQGYDLTVYNRTRDKAKPLESLGARLANSPLEAAKGAAILITMVGDDKALESVLWGSHGALAGLSTDAIHISMSTISEDLAEKTTAAHQAHGSRHIGAPVFGRPPAAAAGKLFVLAAGAQSALEQSEDVFGVLGQKTLTIGETPKSAHLTKILGNFMLFSAIEAMAEAIAHAKASGLDERLFLNAMTSSVFSSPFYANYGTMMVQQMFPTEQSVNFHLALKDITLALESAERNAVNLPTAKLVAARLSEGIARGLGQLDVSALVKLGATHT